MLTTLKFEKKKKLKIILFLQNLCFSFSSNVVLWQDLRERWQWSSFSSSFFWKEKKAGTYSPFRLGEHAQKKSAEIVLDDGKFGVQIVEDFLNLFKIVWMYFELDSAIGKGG